MSKPIHLILTAFWRPNSSHKSFGPAAYVGLLIATAGVTVLCGSGVAYSGPCAVQIAQLERQIRDAAAGQESGPTAPQSVAAQLHHQPTPNTVRNAEREAQAGAAAALDRARQADAGGSAIACVTALGEGKHHWIFPLRLGFSSRVFGSAPHRAARISGRGIPISRSPSGEDARTMTAPHAAKGGQGGDG